MTTNDMVSLRAIAEELGVKYTSLVDCKNRFQDLLHGRSVGLQVKYPGRLVDFFKVVYALREEGYPYYKIKNILLNGNTTEKDGFIKEWVDTWRREFSIIPDCSIENLGGNGGVRGDLGSQRTNGRTDERTDGRMNGWTDERTSLNDSGGRRPANNFAPESGKVMMNTQGVGLEKFKEELIGINAELVVGLGREVENVMASMTADINMALTQYYRSITALRDVVENLADQVGGEGKALMKQMPELDLTKCQVAAPSLQWNPPSAEEIRERQDQDSDADISRVVESIKLGRPDKDVVIDWLKAQKATKPDIAYSTLADMLNAAGIPTLRGLEKWSRGVVRSLISEDE